MTETKNGKYIIKEPMYKGRRTGSKPMIHICAEEDCYGAIFPEFPAELTIDCIKEPLIMSPEPHAHDYDQYLCFIGSNLMNYYEFGAEIELSLEDEKHVINSTSIVYIPGGLMHCPLVFKKVDKPVLFIHVTFDPVYKRTGEISDHPPHRNRQKYTLEEIKKLKGLNSEI